MACSSLKRVQILRKGFVCAEATTAALNLATMIKQQFWARTGRIVVAEVVWS